MARVILGPLINDIRGSIGNQVFDNYGGVHIVRAKPSYTTNPQSAQQTIVRTATAVFVSAWQSMTLAQQQAWVEVAATFPTGKESDAKLSRGGLVTVPRGPFSPWNAFLACNMNRYLSGYSLITDILIVPPLGLSLPEPLKALHATSSTGQIFVDWEYINPGPKAERLEIWIKSVDALVHPQMIYTEARNANGTLTISAVRSRGGVYITPPRGTYKIQAQIVDKYGRTSQPSELVLTRIQGDDMFTYFTIDQQVISFGSQTANIAETDLDLSLLIPAGAHSAIFLIELRSNDGAGGRSQLRLRKSAGTHDMMTGTIKGDNWGSAFDNGVCEIDSARHIKYQFAILDGTANIAIVLHLLGYIS